MDRGVPTEEVLPTGQARGLKAPEMRAAEPPVHYLVGTPKGRLTRLERHLIAKPWQEARPGVQSLPRPSCFVSEDWRDGVRLWQAVCWLRERLMDRHG
jgi:hypothetical protein